MIQAHFRNQAQMMGPTADVVGQDKRRQVRGEYDIPYSRQKLTVIQLLNKLLIKTNSECKQFLMQAPHNPFVFPDREVCV